MGDLSKWNPWILTILIFFPLFGAMLVAAAPRAFSRGATVAIAAIRVLYSAFSARLMSSSFTFSGKPERAAAR